MTWLLVLPPESCFPQQRGRRLRGRSDVRGGTNISGWESPPRKKIWLDDGGRGGHAHEGGEKQEESVEGRRAGKPNCRMAKKD